jgi:hypothetical protein
MVPAQSMRFCARDELNFSSAKTNGRSFIIPYRTTGVLTRRFMSDRNFPVFSMGYFPAFNSCVIYMWQHGHTVH